MRGEQTGVEAVASSLAVTSGADTRGAVTGSWTAGDGLEMAGERCQLCTSDTSAGRE
jgi:hypothetical protein